MKSKKKESPVREAAGRFFSNVPGCVGFFVYLLIVIVAIIGPVVYPVDPFDLVFAPFEPPGNEFAPLGTDYLGRDILAGIVHGSRVTVLIGLFSALLSSVIGIFFGVLSGYFRGMLEKIGLFFIEFFQTLPALLLSMVIITLFSPTFLIICISIAIVSWTPVARICRAEILRIRELDYVQAAKVSGAGDSYLIGCVILPNAMPPLVVVSALTIGAAILFESGLSYLGLSDPNVFSWGYMIGSNRKYIFDAWWSITFPGVAIFITVLSVSLIGDALNEALNPKLSKS